jgi:hypothetical protein
MLSHNDTSTKIFCRAIVVVLGLVAFIPANAEKTLNSQKLIHLLGIGQQELTSLDQGKTVYFNVAEDDKKELAAGVVIYLPTAPSRIIQYIHKKGLASLDLDVIAQGTIPLQATLETFKGFGFKVGDDEAEDFSQEAPERRFNLSTQEFQTLRDTGSARPAEASQTYRKILLGRWQTYRKNGLTGIASYDRDNGTKANPSEELRLATLDSKILAHYFPELYQAWLNYPSALPAGTEEQYFWLNRKVEGRPTAILGHRIMLSAGNGEVILSRQFYVGHSYNSNQLSIACLPYHDGSLVFYANRNFTDQVAGFGSNLKHSIGREQMQGEIIKRLINLRKALK